MQQTDKCRRCDPARTSATSDIAEQLSLFTHLFSLSLLLTLDGMCMKAPVALRLFSAVITSIDSRTVHFKKRSREEQLKRNEAKWFISHPYANNPSLCAADKCSTFIFY